MKRTLLIGMILLSLLAVPAAAYEINMGYNGYIDEYSGQPTNETPGFSNADIVALGVDAYYDRLEGMFVYQLSGESEVRSSVANGMITNDAVRISIPDGLEYVLNRDGQQVSIGALNALNEEGIYDLSFPSQSAFTLRFTIVNEKTADLFEYRMPEHFRVSEVQKNGTPVDTASGVADLSAEGNYLVTYLCTETGIPYQLALSVDRTPPVLALTAVVDGVAKGPVDLSDLEEGAQLSVKLDGNDEGYTTLLTKSGSYVVTVTDRAGNSTVYKFKLQVYFNTSSIVFLVLFPVLVIALAVYLVHSRKHLRVR